MFDANRIIINNQQNNNFQMSGRPKIKGISRFKPQSNMSKHALIGDNTDYVRYKTQDNQPRLSDTLFKPINLKKSMTSRKMVNFSLQNILRDNSRKRKMCLESIIPQYKPIVKPVIMEQKISLSRRQKQNIKQSILQAIHETPKKSRELTRHNEKIIRSSFNKIVKQMKQKSYIRRQDQKQVYKNKIEGYGASVKGEKHNVNQDSLVYSEGVYIICDGHGTNGKQISQFVSNLTHKLFQQALKNNKIDQNIIKLLLKKVQVELDLFGIDIAFSGCTFVAIVIHQNTIYSINVGDSKAILCQGLAITPITTLHKPDNLIERQRIELCGGVIHPLQIGKDKFSGPNRIWAPGKASWGPGLALSRAFGDKSARKYGVISQPQIRTYTLCYEDDFIIIGSDGLFDFLKDSEISFYVRRHLKEDINKQQIPVRLVEQAKRIASTDSDDISCIIVFL